MTKLSVHTADSGIQAFKMDGGSRMTMTQALISGAVQGITEFLPISSDGHLALLHNYFRWSEPALFFDICLHIATVVAIVIYFRRDIIELLTKRDLKTAGYIAVTMVPAGIVGVLFEESIESAFASPRLVSIFFIVTALALFAAQWAMKARAGKNTGISYVKALFIGVAQAAALLPGVSRSGMTVSAGLISGLEAEKAFRFSFLMAVPIILAAFGYKALKVDLAAEVGGNLAGYAAGGAAALVFGLGSLAILDKVIKSRKLFIFGIYCFLLGIVGILFL